MKLAVRLFYLYLFSLSISCVAQGSDYVIIGTVNSIPYTLPEYELCKRNYKVLNNDNQNSNFNEGLVEFKLQQYLALKLGLINNLSYNGFLNSFHDENLRRAQMLAQKKVFYGPVAFSEDTYFSYYISNLILALKNEYFKTKFVFDEKRLRNIYDQKKDILYKIPEIVLGLKVQIVSNPQDSVCCKLVSQNIENILRKTSQISTENSYPDKVKVSIVYLNINPESFKELEMENYFELSEMSKNTNAGGLITYHKSPGNFEIYKILDKLNMGFKTFESVKNALISMDLNSQYAEYINTLKENSINVQF